MAGRGRGRPRKGRMRKSQSQVEDTLADPSPEVTGVPGISASQIRLESVEDFDKSCSQRKAVQSSEVNSIKRTPLAPLQTNGVTPLSPPPSPNASNCIGKDRSRVQQICDAIDAEVQVREEAIKSIASTQLRSIKSQLQLRLSMLPEEVRKMLLLEYLKSYPNIVAKVADDGRIQLHRISPAAVSSRDNKKNLCESSSMARDIPPDEPISLFSTPALDPVKTSGSRFTSEELSWPEYHAKLQALGHIGVYPASGGPRFKQDSATLDYARNEAYLLTKILLPRVEGDVLPVSSKNGLFRGMTPKTVRIPKEGEGLLSLNGSPLGQFGLTPGPNVDSLVSARKIPGTRTTRSSTKRSLGHLLR